MNDQRAALIETLIENYAWESHENYCRAHEVFNEAYKAALQSQEVQALKKQRAELLSLVEEMVINDTYETEYDGRMYSICHGCSAQDDQDHNPSCVYVRAREAMEKQK